MSKNNQLVLEREKDFESLIHLSMFCTNNNKKIKGLKIKGLVMLVPYPSQAN